MYTCMYVCVCVFQDPASGMTMDYFKALGGVKYTALPELRGNNFVVLPDQIPFAFLETWNGIVAAINAIP